MDANAAPAQNAPRAVGVPIATAFGALLTGNIFAYMTDAQPASNARTAWLVWSIGLAACGVVLRRGVRGRPLVLAATLFVAVLLGGSIALSVADYPAAARSEEGMHRAPAALPVPATSTAP